MKKTKKKTIALIAHDNKKADIVNWALKNIKTLEQFDLCGTGTTAKLVAEATELPVKRYLSGPLGGDQQIGAMLANGELGLIVFLRDPPYRPAPRARRFGSAPSLRRSKDPPCDQREQRHYNA